MICIFSEGKVRTLSVFSLFAVFKIWELLILISVRQYNKTYLSQVVENQTSTVKLMT